VSDRDSILVVSGLPRSGTSMMMKMLEAGGIPVLTDKLRLADQNNPNGYYEFERVKQLKDGDFGWLEEAKGKVVKIIAALITHLPTNYSYKVIFMQRDLLEVLASQRKMLGRLGKPEDKVGDEQMAKIYQGHLRNVETWLKRQPNIELLMVNYNQMIDDPTDPILKLNRFLGGELDTQAMFGVINKDLYRERK
jgi:Sulfotransferase domain